MLYSAEPKAQLQFKKIIRQFAEGLLAQMQANAKEMQTKYNIYCDKTELTKELLRDLKQLAE